MDHWRVLILMPEELHPDYSLCPSCPEIKRKIDRIDLVARKGDKIMISATAGECTKFVKGTVSQANTFATATDQAAIDTNLGRIGTAYETSADADTTQKMWLGVF